MRQIRILSTSSKLIASPHRWYSPVVRADSCAETCCAIPSFPPLRRYSEYSGGAKGVNSNVGLATPARTSLSAAISSPIDENGSAIKSFRVLRRSCAQGYPPIRGISRVGSTFSEIVPGVHV